MHEAKRRLYERCRLNKKTGCLEWQGAVINRVDRSRAYGVLRFRGRNVLVHRLSWEVAYGPVPEGLNVLHRCDNPRCFNPDHLFLGTQADNLADCIAKGRCSQGEGHYNSKLTEADVVTIRRMKASGSSYKTLREMFGVSQGVVQRVVAGKSWRHVKEHFNASP